MKEKNRMEMWSGREEDRRKRERKKEMEEETNTEKTFFGINRIDV